MRNMAILLITVMGLWLYGPSAHADGGSCSYSLYSAYLKRSFPVCQNVRVAERCGTWPKSPTPMSNKRVMATAVGKAEGKLHMDARRCHGTGAVGVCLVPDGEIYFYDGNPKELASGCRWMHGEWKPLVALTTAADGDMAKSSP